MVNALPTFTTLKLDVLLSDINSFLYSLSWYNLKSYPDNEESEISNTKLLFLTEIIWGFIRDIDCVKPPVEPIPVILGISFDASIRVSHNFMLSLSTLYTN